MLGHIVRKEILANLSSPAFVTTFVLCCGLILLSVYTGLRSYEDQVSESHLARSLNRENLRELTRYRDVGNRGVQLSKPAKVLGILVSGVENSLGRHITVNTRISARPAVYCKQDRGQPDFCAVRRSGPDVHREDRAEPSGNPLHLQRDLG